MVNARIHVICGNCGRNNMWKFEIMRDGIDVDGEIFIDTATMTCENGSTVHFLDEIEDLYIGREYHNSEQRELLP